MPHTEKPPDMTEQENELVLDEVLEVSPEELTDDQKTFLQDNADDLSDDQKETFKDVLTKEEKKEEGIDLDKIEIETRGGGKKVEIDDDIDDDDKKIISKVVDAKLKEAGVGSTRDQLEVDAYLRTSPEMGKYRGAILKYMANPAYSKIPAHNIAAIVSAKEQQAIGAKKEREAAKKASETKGGGSTVRKTPSGGTDWFKATPEEFAAKRAEVLGHRM